VRPLLLLVLLLTGCTSSPGRGSRLAPWNWFSPDQSTALQVQEQKTEAAADKLVKKAQENVRATGKGIALLPSGLLKQVLEEYNTRADSELAVAVGALPAQTDRELATLVQQLTSDNAALRAQGADAAEKRQRIESGLGRELEEARQREAALTDKLQASDLKYQAEAEQARRWKFWIGAGIAGWLALQVLTGLARFYPALAPLSHLTGMLSSPAMHAAYNRVTSATGQALADAERISKEAADTIRQQIEAPMDAADQAAIRKKYEAAIRP
jgi:ElaB/YqjD/DUF883 family membrane-anchored ribosome-binding protein